MADPQSDDKNDFAAQSEEARVGLVGEFLDFLKDNKKWWLAPILFVLLIFGGLLILAQGSAVAPFIYTVF